MFAFINKIVVPENRVILSKLNRRDDSKYTCLYTVFAFINKKTVPENKDILAKLNRGDNINQSCLYTKNMSFDIQTHKLTNIQ